ncbi:hypothetical protein KCP75_26055 [Salmonella enterica subsp. enterica]|nr:hypothetical protein KCP75_26055 [Salmonella enterica subsp. enterica]
MSVRKCPAGVRNDNGAPDRLADIKPTYAHIMLPASGGRKYKLSTDAAAQDSAGPMPPSWLMVLSKKERSRRMILLQLYRRDKRYPTHFRYGSIVTQPIK